MSGTTIAEGVSIGLGIVENAVANAPGIVAAGTDAAAQVKAITAPGLAPGDIAARLAAVEALVGDAVAFLTFLFPGHPGLPTAK